MSSRAKISLVVLDRDARRAAQLIESFREALKEHGKIVEEPGVTVDRKLLVMGEPLVFRCHDQVLWNEASCSAEEVLEEWRWRHLFPGDPPFALAIEFDPVRDPDFPVLVQCGDETILLEKRKLAEALLDSGEGGVGRESLRLSSFLGALWDDYIFRSEMKDVREVFRREAIACRAGRRLEEVLPASVGPSLPAPRF